MKYQVVRVVLTLALSDCVSSTLNIGLSRWVAVHRGGSRDNDQAPYSNIPFIETLGDESEGRAKKKKRRRKHDSVLASTADVQYSKSSRPGQKKIIKIDHTVIRNSRAESVQNRDDGLHRRHHGVSSAVERGQPVDLDIDTADHDDRKLTNVNVSTDESFPISDLKDSDTPLYTGKKKVKSKKKRKRTRTGEQEPSVHVALDDNDLDVVVNEPVRNKKQPHSRHNRQSVEPERKIHTEQRDNIKLDVLIKQRDDIEQEVLISDSKPGVQDDTLPKKKKKKKKSSRSNHSNVTGTDTTDSNAETRGSSFPSHSRPHLTKSRRPSTIDDEELNQSISKVIDKEPTTVSLDATDFATVTNNDTTDNDSSTITEAPMATKKRVKKKRKTRQPSHNKGDVTNPMPPTEAEQPVVAIDSKDISDSSIMKDIEIQVAKKSRKKKKTKRRRAPDSTSSSIPLLDGTNDRNIEATNVNLGLTVDAKASIDANTTHAANSSKQAINSSTPVLSTDANNSTSDAGNNKPDMILEISPVEDDNIRRQVHVKAKSKDKPSSWLKRLSPWGVSSANNDNNDKEKYIKAVNVDDLASKAPKMDTIAVRPQQDKAKMANPVAEVQKFSIQEETAAVNVVEETILNPDSVIDNPSLPTNPSTSRTYKFDTIAPVEVTSSDSTLLPVAEVEIEVSTTTDISYVTDGEDEDENSIASALNDTADTDDVTVVTNVDTEDLSDKDEGYDYLATNTDSDNVLPDTNDTVNDVVVSEDELVESSSSSHVEELALQTEDLEDVDGTKIPTIQGLESASSPTTYANVTAQILTVTPNLLPNEQFGRNSVVGAVTNTDESADENNSGTKLDDDSVKICEANVSTPLVSSNTTTTDVEVSSDTLIVDGSIDADIPLEDKPKIDDNEEPSSNADALDDNDETLDDSDATSDDDDIEDGSDSDTYDTSDSDENVDDDEEEEEDATSVSSLLDQHNNTIAEPKDTVKYVYNVSNSAAKIDGVEKSTRTFETEASMAKAVEDDTDDSQDDEDEDSDSDERDKNQEDEMADVRDESDSDLGEESDEDDNIVAGRSVMIFKRQSDGNGSSSKRWNDADDDDDEEEYSDDTELTCSVVEDSDELTAPEVSRTSQDISGTDDSDVYVDDVAKVDVELKVNITSLLVDIEDENVTHSQTTTKETSIMERKGSQPSTLVSDDPERLQQRMSRRESLFKSIQTLGNTANSKDDITVSVVSWNLAEDSPSESDASFIKQFRQSKKHNGSDIILISGQECENIKPRRTEGHRSREFRRLMIKMLGKQYVPIALHMLGGIQFGLFCKRSILQEIEHVSIGDVTCGIGNVFHNKGAIGAYVKLRAKNGDSSDSTQLKRSNSVKLLFITAHMAAHVKNSDARDADYWRIVTELEAQAPPRYLKSASGLLEHESLLLHSADRVFFCGDLNYRLDLPREQVENALNCIEKAKAKNDDTKSSSVLQSLLKHDQLLSSIAEKRAFFGLTEGPVTFMPTFKFDKGSHEYDTSHKQRIPAWTDRVLFKPAGTRLIEYSSVLEAQTSDHRPVFATFEVDRQGSVVSSSQSKSKRKKASRDAAATHKTSDDK